MDQVWRQGRSPREHETESDTARGARGSAARRR